MSSLQVDPDTCKEAPDKARVTAPVKRGWRVFDARCISMFRAQSKYTTFAVDGHEYMISEPLQALEERLRGHGFARVHRGTLVNLLMVCEVQRRGRQTVLVLTDHTQVTVSRRYSGTLGKVLRLGASKKAGIPSESSSQVVPALPMSTSHAHNFQPGCERTP